MQHPDCAGFWIRVAATVIDSVLILAVITPFILLLGEPMHNISDSTLPTAENLILNYFIPALAIIAFWMYKSSTPGKMIFHLKIVDAKTGEKPTKKQLIGRYFAYYIRYFLSCSALCGLRSTQKNRDGTIKWQERSLLRQNSRTNI